MTEPNGQPEEYRGPPIIQITMQQTDVEDQYHLQLVHAGFDGGWEQVKKILLSALDIAYTKIAEAQTQGQAPLVEVPGFIWPPDIMDNKHRN